MTLEQISLKLDCQELMNVREKVIFKVQNQSYLAYVASDANSHWSASEQNVVGGRAALHN